MRLVAHQILTQRAASGGVRSLRARHLLLVDDGDGELILSVRDEAPATAAGIELPPLTVSAATLASEFLRKGHRYPPPAVGRDRPLFVVQPVTALTPVGGGFEWRKDDIIAGPTFLYRQATTFASRYNNSATPAARAVVLPTMERIDVASHRRVCAAAGEIGPGFSLADLESAHARMRFHSGGFAESRLAA